MRTKPLVRSLCQRLMKNVNGAHVFSASVSPSSRGAESGPSVCARSVLTHSIDGTYLTAHPRPKMCGVHHCFTSAPYTPSNASVGEYWHKVRWVWSLCSRPNIHLTPAITSARIVIFAFAAAFNATAIASGKKENLERVSVTTLSR